MVNKTLKKGSQTLDNIMRTLLAKNVFLNNKNCK